jgi:purine catabolism regulator
LHRHTVVYRLGRIRELLGVDLDDAVVRHQLWLALLLHGLGSSGDPDRPLSR